MKIRIEKVKVMDGKIKIEFGSVLGKAKSDWSEFFDLENGRIAQRL